MDSEQEDNSNIKSNFDPKGFGKLTYNFSDLNLNEIDSKSTDVEFIIERRPISMEVGQTYGTPAGVLIDKKSPKVETLLQMARSLKELPEEERLQKVMVLVRENVKYPYPEVISELEHTNEGLAEWINMNMVKDNYMITLSDLLDKGYGICRHLSVLYLFLAQEAGLQGSISKTDPGNPINNILRTDTNKPLFKLGEIGDPVSGHAWVDIFLPSGKLVPVDPSTNLIGNTPERLEMFKAANYLTGATFNLESHVDSTEGIVGLFNKTYFKPGEVVTNGSAYIAPKRHLSLDKGWSFTPYRGSTVLTISQKLGYTDSISTLAYKS